MVWGQRYCPGGMVAISRVGPLTALYTGHTRFYPPPQLSSLLPLMWLIKIIKNIKHFSIPTIILDSNRHIGRHKEFSEVCIDLEVCWRSCDGRKMEVYEGAGEGESWSIPLSRVMDTNFFISPSLIIKQPSHSCPIFLILLQILPATLSENRKT